MQYQTHAATPSQFHYFSKIKQGFFRQQARVKSQFEKLGSGAAEGSILIKFFVYKHDKCSYKRRNRSSLYSN